MKDRYKIIISNRNLYREGELTEEMERLSIGTGKDCDVRLFADMFFEPVRLFLINTEGQWSVQVSENLYMSCGEKDIRKLQACELRHGDMLKVHYRRSDGFVFNLGFIRDFENGHRKYDRFADCSMMSRIRIGSGEENDVVPGGEYARFERLELKRRGNDFELEILNSDYGVLINGRPAKNGEIIKNGDFFSAADLFFFLKNDHLWTDKGNHTVFRNMPVYDAVNRGKYPKFRRNSRIRISVNEEKIPVIDPAQNPKKPKNNLLLRLLPSVGMLLAAGAMAAIGGSTMIIFSLVSVTVGAVTAILTVRQNNKDYLESVEERKNTYYRYIDEKRAEIDQCRNEERKTLEEIYIPLEQASRNIHLFSSDLFDRVREDDDFLCVRLGTGDILSRRIIDYKKQEKLEPGDELQQIPEMLCEEYKYIRSVPVFCDLKEMNAIGVTGKEKHRYEILKNMVIDLAARQYYSDVVMVIAAEEEHKDKIRWMRMLPNLYNNQLGVRNLVMNDESRTLIFEYLYKELSLREESKSFDNRIVVFLYDECGFQSHPVYRYTEKANELGVNFIFFGETKADIPIGCDRIISLEAEDSGYLINAHDRSDITFFTYPVLTQEQAERLIELLAPVYTEEVSLEGSLTKSISMFDLLNIITAADLDLEARWAASNVTRSMAAPIGVSKTGVISLDLHDTAHGPHGLVAGTTGSGKSELLQTYILAMATLYHPSEVGFMIIDFKGGGMVNQFGELPHLMGSITNIDGKEIDRSLKSIKAELQKRQRLFADADVNHIDKYIQLYKKGEAATPLPHLIIIVDEFAELKAEQPEFMKELISAARIGRSLGVHLILATQKPAGQVNEQIWSNSRFKLCLKVQSREDSNEVIKSPLAAEIKEPGRAYLQVGNNEIFELFQSAYSGVPEKTDDSSVKEFSIIELTDSGRRVPVYVQKKEKKKQSRTQLESITEHVRKYCDEHMIRKLPDICLPALPMHMAYLSGENSNQTVQGTGFDIGIYDDPDNQLQESCVIDVISRHTLIVGSSQFGKTNLLQLFIRAIAENGSPAESVIYILDFGSLILKNFDELKHVGGVVTSAEDEKLKNLFKLLLTEIEMRRIRMLEVGVSSHSAYKEAGYNDIPHIFLIIDNFISLWELYLNNDDSLLTILREGLSVGISVVSTNMTASGINYRYLSNYSNRIAFYCNDANEYYNMFDRNGIRPDEIPGRCIFEYDKNILECQTYLAFEGDKEVVRVNNIRNFVETINTGTEIRAKTIPFIPKVLTKEILANRFGSISQGYIIPFGITYDEVEPFWLDVSSLGIFGLCGKNKNDRFGFIEYILNELAADVEHFPAKAVIFDDISRSFEGLKTHPLVSGYYSGNDGAEEIIREWHEELRKRYNMLAADGKQSERGELLLMVIQNNDLAKRIESNINTMDQFNEMTERFRGLNFAVIFSDYPSTAISYDAPEPLRKIKNRRHLLMFDNLENLKSIDVPYEALRTYKKRLEAGDAYYIDDNECIKLKTVSV